MRKKFCSSQSPDPFIVSNLVLFSPLLRMWHWATVAGLASANPLLANITDYLIEEASAEEEELLGKKEGGEEEEGEEVAEGDTLHRDEELIKVQLL